MFECYGKAYLLGLKDESSDAVLHFYDNGY